MASKPIAGGEEEVGWLGNTVLARPHCFDVPFQRVLLKSKYYSRRFLIFATYRMITSWYLRYFKYLRSWYLSHTTWSDRRERSRVAACPCNLPWRGSPLPEGSPEPIICNINQFLSWRLCYLHFTRFDNSNSPKCCPTGPQYPSPRRTRSMNNRSQRRCSKSNTEKKNEFMWQTVRFW